MGWPQLLQLSHVDKTLLSYSDYSKNKTEERAVVA